MRIYGYSRVSTKDQNLDRQLVELKKFVEDRFIFQDKLSGKDFDRPQYQLMRKVAQKGDIIYVKSLDRLGRNKSQVKEELEYYKNEGVRVKVLDIPTTMMDIPEGQEWLMDMINNLLIEVLATMAEQERVNIKQRQAEGIAIAKEKGAYKGRKKIEVDDTFKDAYDKWKAGEITAVKAMEITGLKRNTFYRRVSEYEENK
ncbi:recombinase family protein [Clostridium saccharobutylicum]|uniref:Putative transposon Tn552 DNA-invertase Bin3 n=1 Tax=Clostridium saccharobutylicum DSM 13864 TaxID=1345695 RepID=U5MWG8_CLOSA|nr:recombinase family protein [Clostridium saccharobutylicum]AGX43966.1 putative transposon Tn552 DNA-invertase Bin3 [Clostridium saccharobutylicum DSM 13864]AQR91263.1 putative DNA-invertase [Clostridium saccharobutylicum]AQS01167.1 putative DNA-invertase bin3 [Clostridium saccharobutylicum]AQS10580.1 putative DNA-invertase bin3 [Clostridium saccharobutylicum]AQS15150.1 putative DNA-invertase bin3 [Clostridium saccharobutylicum]